MLTKILTSLLVFSFLFVLSLGVTFSTVHAQINPFGTIDAPPGTKEYIADAVSEGANPDDIALIFFISRMIMLVNLVAGIWTVVMFMIAGYIYISSNGDTGAHGKVRNQVTNGFLGLFFILLSYTMAGLVGLIIFGNAGFILNPQIPSAI